MKRIIVALIVCMFSLALYSHAGMIDDVIGTPDNAYPVFGVNEYPNNDDVDFDIEDIFDTEPPPGLNFLILGKEYDMMEPIDIQFGVNSSGGTTEYLFVEGVGNFTGIPWTD